MRDTLRDAFSGSRLFTTACASLAVFLLATLPAASSNAAGILFPEPLHLTREIHDPISGTTTTVDEYCQGNRISAVSGKRITVVDYERGEILSIDRTAGTYSIASFEIVAAAAVRSPKPSKTQWRIEPLNSGHAASAGRLNEDARVDRVVATRDTSDGPSRIELALSRDVRISREAIEALLGSSYPSPSSPALDVIAQVIEASPDLQSKTAGEPVRYPLPVEQRTAYAAGGETVEFSVRVVRVGRELAPMDLVAIPAGFRRVDDVVSTRARALRELDSLPTNGSTRP